jgi:O-methyltransferase
MNATQTQTPTLEEALEEIRLLKIRLEEAPPIDYQLLMEFQAKLIGFTDAEPEFARLYERVKSYTMTSIERLYAMHKATEYVVKAGIPGDFVECGVWRGGSMMMAALSLMALGDTSRRLLLFDTFAGHPQPDPVKDGKQFYDEWARRRRTEQSSYWAEASIDEVQSNLNSTGYPPQNIKLIKGITQETVPNNLPDAIALLRLDTDWYDSTANELKHLYPRIRPGGVLLIDDYGSMGGQRQAVDEYFRDNRITIMLNRVDFSGRMAVKPHSA